MHIIKASDNIKHDELLILNAIGVNGKDLRIIANIYRSQLAALWLENYILNCVSIGRGERQGCVLSQDFYNIYSEKIFNEIKEMGMIDLNGVGETLAWS